MRNLLLLLVILLCKPTSSYSQKFDIKLSAFINTGISIYSDSINPYNDWMDNFLPHGGSMDIRTKRNRVDFDFGVVVEPTLIFDVNWAKKLQFQIGLPGYLSLRTILPKSPAIIRVNWWNDVTIRGHRIKYLLPTFGISAGISDFNHLLYLSFLLTRYDLAAEDYSGYDCSGCQNKSDVFRSNTFEEGWSKKIIIGFGETSGKKDFTVGLYLDFASDKTVAFGANIKGGINIFHQ